MPGIFGVVEKSLPGGGDARVRPILEGMARAMHYESFYTCQQGQYGEVGVHVGIVSRDTGGNGPVASHDPNGVSLFVAGEAYAAWPARCQTPTPELMVAEYRRTGALFPAQFHGIFSGCLVDVPHRRCLLFSDRLGMERLFVHENDERLLFASEAKAILAVEAGTRAFDTEGLAELFACGGTLDGRSIFRGIRVVPAGTVLELEPRRSPRSRTYFDREVWERATPLAAHEFLPELGSTLDAVVAQHIKVPPAVAVSLTGGFDSRMIMAALDAPAGAVPTYTFGSQYRDTYDVRVSRRVSRDCGQPHQVLVLGDEFVRSAADQFERAVFISDGYLGLSGAAELFLNASARTIAPVRITGNYGGELLRGFRAFGARVPRGDFLVPELAAQVREVQRRFTRLSAMPPLSFTLFCQAPAGYGRYAIERSQVAVRSPFLDDRLLSVLYRAPGGVSNQTDASRYLVGRRRRGLLAIPTDRGYLGQGGALVRAGRRAYREALFKAEYMTGHGAPDWMVPLLRYRAGRALEEIFVGRHKFFHPRVLLRGGFGTYMRDTLLERSSAFTQFVDRERVETMLRQQLAGERNYLNEVDMLLALGLAEQTLLRPRSARLVP